MPAKLSTPVYGRAKRWPSVNTRGAASGPAHDAQPQANQRAGRNHRDDTQLVAQQGDGRRHHQYQRHPIEP